MEPGALQFIEEDERLDLPDLVPKLLAAGEQVGSYLFDGCWLDIGRHDDYEKAIAEYEVLQYQLGSAAGDIPVPAPQRSSA